MAMIDSPASGPERSLHGLEAPSPWVARFAALVPRGEVLDVASGAGRHARLFADRGNQVTAIDRDPESLKRCEGAGIQTVICDLESGDPQQEWPFPGRTFQGIIVTNYLHRPLFPILFAALAEGGVLIYETFAAGNGRFGKPSNPAFLLHPGELLDHAIAHRAQGVRVIAYEDGYVSHPKAAMVQRLCAIRAVGNPEQDALSLS